MTALLSRAAQASSFCRCRACLSTPSAIVRRTTTRAPRRKLTATDIFTAAYTTIFGAAAVLDARSKDARRKDLDEKLERARAAVAALTTTKSTDAQATEQLSASTGLDGDKRRSKRIPKPQSIDDIVAELRVVASGIHRSRLRDSWLQHQIDWLETEAAIKNEEIEPRIYLRHPKTDYYLGLNQQIAEDLIQQLVRRAREYPRGVDIEGHGADSEGDRLLRRIEQMHAESPYPSYEHAGAPAAVVDTTSYLNESFRRIFNRTISHKEVVGKICYNLLLSSSPPNIHNYNVLIAGFNRIQRPDLAQVVVDSYLDRVRWPATHRTILCLLHHARGLNDLRQFREIVGRIRGSIGAGLNYKIVPKDHAPDDKRRDWANARYYEGKNARVTRAKRGNQVFDEVIRGWLHFGQINTACMTFVACIRSGRMIAVETLEELLTACLGSVNRSSAEKLLVGLAQNFSRFEAMIDDIFAKATVQLVRRIVDMFQALFDLCGAPFNTDIPLIRSERAYENETWYREVSAMFGRFNVLTGAELKLAEVAAMTSTVHEHLSSSASLGSSVEDALATLESTEQRRARSAQIHQNYKKVATVAMLAKRCEKVQWWTRRLSAHAKASIIRYKTGCQIDPNGVLPPVDRLSRNFGDIYPAVFYALESIELKPGPLSMEDIAAQLSSKVPNHKLAKHLGELSDKGALGLQTIVSFFDEKTVQISESQQWIRRGNRRWMQQALKRWLQFGTGTSWEIDLDARVIVFLHIMSLLSHSEQSIFMATQPAWHTMSLETLMNHSINVVDSLRLSGYATAEAEIEVSEQVVAAPEKQRPMPSIPAPAQEELEIVHEEQTVSFEARFLQAAVG